MRKDRLTTAKTVKIGNWLIKASSIDDQILIVLMNTESLIVYCEMFYNEDLAHNFIERVLSDD